jgi:hypothetical protein
MNDPSQAMLPIEMRQFLPEATAAATAPAA